MLNKSIAFGTVHKNRSKPLGKAEQTRYEALKLFRTTAEPTLYELKELLFETTTSRTKNPNAETYQAIRGFTAMLSELQQNDLFKSLRPTRYITLLRDFLEANERWFRGQQHDKDIKALYAMLKEITSLSIQKHKSREEQDTAEGPQFSETKKISFFKKVFRP